MKVRVDLTQADLERLVIAELSERLGSAHTFDTAKILLEVKASMNYRSEWEKGEFRATVEVTL